MELISTEACPRCCAWSIDDWSPCNLQPHNVHLEIYSLVWNVTCDRTPFTAIGFTSLLVSSSSLWATLLLMNATTHLESKQAVIHCSRDSEAAVIAAYHHACFGSHWMSRVEASVAWPFIYPPYLPRLLPQSSYHGPIPILVSPSPPPGLPSAVLVRLACLSRPGSVPSAGLWWPGPFLLSCMPYPRFGIGTTLALQRGHGS